MRIALPKGRLLPGVLELLAQAGLSFTFHSDRDYRPAASEPGVVARLFKPRAIPQLLALDRYDVGFCGLDLVLEADYPQVAPLLDLRLNPVELVVAVPRDLADLLQSPPRRPIVVATEYPNLSARWALKHNLAHIAIQTWGSTEAFAPDEADVIFDCMETGRTIEANGLVVLERIAASTTHLCASRAALERPERAAAVQAFVRRLEEQVRAGHRQAE